MPLVPWLFQAREGRGSQSAASLLPRPLGRISHPGAQVAQAGQNRGRLPKNAVESLLDGGPNRQNHAMDRTRSTSARPGG